MTCGLLALDGVALAHVVLEAADHLLDFAAQRGDLRARLRRGVTVRVAERPGQVRGSVGGGAARVDQDELGAAVL